MMKKYQRFLGIALILVVSLLGVARMAEAQQRKPDASAPINLVSLAFIGGVEWGKGTLTFKGKDHTFKVKGLKAGGIGIKHDSVRAKVYNLNKSSDFAGTYFALEAAATVAGGGSARAMKNQNGVELHLFSVTMGADLTLAAEGINVRFDK